MPVKRSRPAKPSRRTRQDIDALKETIAQVLEEIQPATVRQLYYQLVSRRAIDKTEREYKGLVRLLGIMRRAFEIPFSYLADSTRWMRKPRSHDGLKDLLEDTARLYRRNLWRNQGAYVEVWLEKDALSGVLYDVTEQFDVPLMVTRGYSSITFLQSAAAAIAEVGKPAYLYYFGDWDPSGVDINRAVEKGLRDFAPGAEIHFQRVAVTEEQIVELGLPTRPTKSGDSRSGKFKGESVEVNAIEPARLRLIVRECIEQHIDLQALETVRKEEKSERDWLETLAAKKIGR